MFEATFMDICKQQLRLPTSACMAGFPGDNHKKNTTKKTPPVRPIKKNTCNQLT
eukprot:CAMPEP_0116857580 /NCGR_PEP_ID=MMETSP0418-20121206/20634_1 /TAXON_ID=1158023 /ORGANISM="Astrosyne radiata, Strain 13vi08-1A" /LENGTH=53 /DNA_ID=CAMNT_0004491283 /DNA_START=377 /DNA_END=535 /DNA_ORIENTATION=-